MARSDRSQQLWKKAKGNVMHVVRVKHRLLGLQGMARDTALMRNKSEDEKKRYVFAIMVSIVVLGAVTAMTKSALFHTSAVGQWDDGHEYKFGYALTLTMVVFVLKVALVGIKKLATSDEEEEEGEVEDIDSGEEEPKSIKDRIMPWVLLVSFTFFEMLSATVASLGLLFGAPTSVFVVFKSSKTIFLAVLSVVVLKRKLNAAQWSSLLLICMSLGLATVAEGKGGKKGGGELNLMGPGLLLLSELFHAIMLILQEIAVRNYWEDPIVLLSTSACVGVVMTFLSMMKVSEMWVTLPDGGRRPASDLMDSLTMCLNSPALMITMLTHLTAHVSSDVTHIVVLKHISALARTMCDAFKLILMWVLAKGFWFFGIVPMLAEAWHPGFVGSWMMLPAIGLIVYAMLMFRDGLFFPLQIRGKRIEESSKAEGGERIKVNLEDPFYMSMFRSKKLKTQMNVRKLRSSGSFSRQKSAR